MVEQGTDGISRGMLQDQAKVQEQMLTLIPFDKTSLERSVGLQDWLLSWCGAEAEVLKTDDWFERAHDISSGY